MHVLRGLITAGLASAATLHVTRRKSDRTSRLRKFAQKEWMS